MRIMPGEEGKSEDYIAQKKKDRRKRNIGVFTGIVCAVMLIAAITSAKRETYNSLPEREIYDSVDEMRDGMQGNWSHRNNDDDILWQLQINGDRATLVFASHFLSSGEQDIAWNPSKGTFMISGTTYIVNKGGRTLTEGLYDYDKGGYIFADKFLQ